MKNLFKISKRRIAAILTLCILLGIAGTCVYAASAMPEENTAVTEKTTQELVPMMATRCGPTYGQGGYTVETGVIPDTSGHNQYGSCSYTIYYYADGSSYGIYTDNRGTQHVQTYSDGTVYKSWWG